jgi:ubiquinone/menaquinone biosynthesis C-methylase UbiE
MVAACGLRPPGVYDGSLSRRHAIGHVRPGALASWSQAKLAVMASKYFNRSSRKERVAAQYSSVESADEYAHAYQDSRTVGRFLRARLRIVQGILASCPGGDLLDAGCGPGVMAQALLKSRPHDFRISVLDQSRAMVEYCATSARALGKVYPAVGELEALPYADATFDITLATGVLEYADASVALSEISRVTRSGGLVVTTMLNPLCPYRIAEWIIYRPLVRAVGAVEECLHVPLERRHKADATGIHGFTPGKLRRLMTQAKLEPVELIYYGPALPIPPFGRLRSIAARAGRAGAHRKPGMGRRSRRLGMGYLVTARRC